MDWELSRADHSIERVTVHFNLYEPLDLNAHDELVIAGRDVAKKQKLTNRADFPDSIRLASEPGTAVQIPLPNLPPRRVVFQRLDNERVSVDELSIGMQEIQIGTLRYRRWKDLNKLIITIISALDKVYPITKATKSIRLEYVDRFQSVPGGADHFEIINRDSKFVNPHLAGIENAFHCHSGWFDFETKNRRRLTNVNIGISDIGTPLPPDPRRKIRILTMAQLEALKGKLDKPLERLDGLHDYLKLIFRDIITQETANRVKLLD